MMTDVQLDAVVRQLSNVAQTLKFLHSDLTGLQADVKTSQVEYRQQVIDLRADLTVYLTAQERQRAEIDNLKKN